MKIKKKVERTKELNLGSMSDIIFLLLFFFMVTAVFKKVSGIPVELPTAENIKKIESRRHVSYVFIDRDGNVLVDDMYVSKVRTDMPNLMYNKRLENPQVLINLKIDRDVKMKRVNEVQNALRQGACLRVVYAANRKAR